jgi:hypothetical protein
VDRLQEHSSDLQEGGHYSMEYTDQRGIRNGIKSVQNAFRQANQKAPDSGLSRTISEASPFSAITFFEAFANFLHFG